MRIINDPITRLKQIQNCLNKIRLRSSLNQRMNTHIDLAMTDILTHNFQNAVNPILSLEYDIKTTNPIHLSSYQSQQIMSNFHLLCRAFRDYYGIIIPQRINPFHMPPRQNCLLTKAPERFGEMISDQIRPERFTPSSKNDPSCATRSYSPVIESSISEVAGHSENDLRKESPGENNSPLNQKGIESSISETAGHSENDLRKEPPGENNSPLNQKGIESSISETAGHSENDLRKEPPGENNSPLNQKRIESSISETAGHPESDLRKEPPGENNSPLSQKGTKKDSIVKKTRLPRFPSGVHVTVSMINGNPLVGEWFYEKAGFLKIKLSEDSCHYRRGQIVYLNTEYIISIA